VVLNAGVGKRMCGNMEEWFDGHKDCYGYEDRVPEDEVITTMLCMEYYYLR
jgi:hypothetical protein